MGEGFTMKYHPKRLLCLLMILCLVFGLPACAEETDLVKLQERLLALGYEIGAADGIAGPKTSSALLLAQTLLAEAGNEIAPTGSPDAKTVGLIMREENAELLRTLREGSWGTRVKEAQTKLISLCLLRGSADGKFGLNTQTAVLAFEEQMEKLLQQVIFP